MAYRNQGHRYRRATKKARGIQRILTDWHGEECAPLEIEAGQKREVRIADILGEVVTSLDRGEKMLLRELMDLWPKIMIPDVASRSAPRKILGKFLYIEVFEPAWRFHFERNFKSEIKSLVCKHSDNRIVDIRFASGGQTRRR